MKPKNGQKRMIMTMSMVRCGIIASLDDPNGRNVRKE